MRLQRLLDTLFDRPAFATLHRIVQDELAVEPGDADRQRRLPMHLGVVADRELEAAAAEVHAEGRGLAEGDPAPEGPEDQPRLLETREHAHLGSELSRDGGGERCAVAGVPKRGRRDRDQPLGAMGAGERVELPGRLDGASRDRFRDLALGGDRRPEPQHRPAANDAFDLARRARVGDHQMEGRTAEVEHRDPQLRVCASVCASVCAPACAASRASQLCQLDLASASPGLDAADRSERSPTEAVNLLELTLGRSDLESRSGGRASALRSQLTSGSRGRERCWTPPP